jgi:hypothetical protein
MSEVLESTAKKRKCTEEAGLWQAACALPRHHQSLGCRSRHRCRCRPRRQRCPPGSRLLRRISGSTRPAIDVTPVSLKIHGRAHLQAKAPQAAGCPHVYAGNPYEDRLRLAQSAGALPDLPGSTWLQTFASPGCCFDWAAMAAATAPPCSTPVRSTGRRHNPSCRWRPPLTRAGEFSHSVRGWKNGLDGEVRPWGAARPT